jgi:hypothetical protein
MKNKVESRWQSSQLVGLALAQLNVLGSRTGVKRCMLVKSRDLLVILQSKNFDREGKVLL